MLRAFFCLLIVTGTAWAADGRFGATAPERHAEMAQHLTKKLPPQKEDIWHRKYLTGNWNGARTWMAEQGWTFSSSFFSDIMASIAGGLARGMTQASSLGLDSNYDFGKLTAAKGLNLYSSVVYRFGSNLSRKKIGNAFNVQQLYGSQTYKLNELYLRQDYRDLVRAKAGRLDTGNDFLQSNLYGQFVSLSINPNPISIFFNGFFSTYPNPTWGAMIAINPGPISAKVGIYNANTEINENRFHGVNFTFANTEGVQPITEWGYHLNRRKEDRGYPGNYRVGAYWLTADRETFLGGCKPNFYSYYVLLDQMIWRPEKADKDQGIIPFTSLIFAPNDRATFPFFCNVGIVAKGLVKKRKMDSINIAVAYGKYSSDLREAQREARACNIQGKYGCKPQTFEMIIELNYWYYVTQWFVITPDIQYVINPSGFGTIPDALVIGAQVGWTF